jgi:hypothetical protein
LESSGYVTLTIEKYEEALKGKAVSEKEMDDVHLSLYKLYGRYATQLSADKAKEAKAKADAYFAKIKDGGNDQVQLERVKSNMESLRRLEFSARTAKADEKDGIVKKARSSFSKIAEVTQKIRVKSREWLTSFDEMEEKEQKKSKRKYMEMSELEANSNLQFGEACVLYASIAGHKDPDVVKWLKVMSKGYEDFIANYFGSFAAIFGGVYYGQVCILLGEFTDDYGGKVDGLKAGATSFLDAIAGLEEFKGRRGVEEHVNTWLVNAHTKHADALAIVGEKEKAIDELKKLFDVLELGEATPRKSEAHHDRMMSALQSLCVMLKDSYAAGNKARVNDFAQFVLQGFNFAKRVESRWFNNFRRLLGALPADDPSIVETLDIASMKADNLYSAASKAKSDAEKKKIYFEAAMKYKTVIEMALLEPKRLDEFYPKAAYRLGRSYFENQNYLLSLGVYLRAVDLYPSTKYPEKDFPKIYSNILRCATGAKGAAIKRYILAGKTKFDQELYERTLLIISEQFPEEGGDPEFWLGYLRKSSGDYAGAAKQLAKIDDSSKMYFKAKYSLLDCDYMQMSEDIESEKLKGDDAIKAARSAMAKKYESLVAISSEKLVKSDDMSDKDFAFLQKSQMQTLAGATQRMASLFYQAEEFKKAHKVLSGLLAKAEESDKFNALKLMISCSYSLADLAMFDADLASYAKLKPTATLSTAMISDFRGKALKMKANLMIQQKLNPLLTKTEGLKGAALEAVERELSPVYVATADLLFEALKISGEQSEDMLKQVIGYYYSSSEGREKALEAMNLYFKWYPDLPELGSWHASMVGKSAEEWDKQLGGIKATINLPMVKKVYDKFLDQLFDSVDYSTMGISKVKKLKKESGDQPRTYQSAMKTYVELEGLSKKDRSFGSKGWPKMKTLMAKLKEANGYYGMRYMQAECLTLLGRYDEASGVFNELSKYYVEYPQVRIELAKAKFAKGTKDGFAAANKIFQELLKVVPSPSMGKAYNPKDFFSLQLWFSRSKLAMVGSKPSEKDIIDAWKYLRSMVYQDVGYVALEGPRLTQLGITAATKPNHVMLVDELKSWVEENIFPVLQKSKDALASDSWKKILGDES